MNSQTSFHHEGVINKKLEQTNKVSLIFSITDKLGGLQEVLNIIRKHNLNMCRIESRPSKTAKWDYDFFVDFENNAQDQMKPLVQELTSLGVGVHGQPSQDDFNSSPLQTSSNVYAIPWFPRKLSDLDEISQKILECGEELEADHPGFHDAEYRKRREEITAIARTYKTGEKIPTIQYTEQEIATWRVVYNELTKLFPTHACKQLNYVFPLLEHNCGYSPDNIPQLEDISRFLQECTGWRLRPVMGLLSSRDFLNGLAFRVFHSTQYIRHHTKPMYTPEPDVCHELLGHVPLFADPDFADFSQQIGLASLGASDTDIEKLATCYWYTVEFGLCKEEGELKAFGAGLLSSFGELKYSLGGDEIKPRYISFDPSEASGRKYPITMYQPIYYVADSFQIAKEKMIEFASKLDRPFSVKYNALTQSVDILDSRDKLIKFVKEIQSELVALSAAISRVSGLKD